MWALTFSFNLPIFYKTKQEQALAEAQVSLSQAKRDLAATELMLASSVKEGYSMVEGRTG